MIEVCASALSASVPAPHAERAPCLLCRVPWTPRSRPGTERAAALLAEARAIIAECPDPRAFSQMDAPGGGLGDPVGGA
jgi:hypothetical protein